MILEVKDLFSSYVYVVERIDSMQLESEYREINKNHYTIHITSKYGRDILKFHAKEEEAKAVYNKIKDAINAFHTRASLKQELLNELKNEN